ncbi:hypothetical protein D3H65_21860 [Paraflavitalea soli]|uniref:Uncharacterized protein n=1 Tax=Paraflavitalea soli TaxID=2315862 RepID=A0A3B7MTT7_9BACT|nr:hypothetical protein [Paraflavitalea soli]AXY76480.1 hypothetical protein D3H65_21860 [Paraflavitalea soli]
MDEFKKYLFDHRDELDAEKPPRPQVWKHIQRETRVVNKSVIPMMVKWMAAAAILVAVSILIYQLQRPAKPDAPQLAENKTKKPAISPESDSPTDSSVGTPSTAVVEEPVVELPSPKLIREKTTPARRLAKKEKTTPNKLPKSPLQAVEDNYATIISYQQQKLEKTPIYTESPGYFHVFKKQWLDLERDEKKVKQDVRLYGMNSNIVDKLIQLYQQKLWLLKELQSEINKMNVRAKQHPDIQRTNPAYLKL